MSTTYGLGTGVLCPYCGGRADAATNFAGEGPPRGPAPGAISVCVYCGNLLEFSGSLQVVPLERREQRDRRDFVNRQHARPPPAWGPIERN